MGSMKSCTSPGTRVRGGGRKRKKKKKKKEEKKEKGSRVPAKFSPLFIRPAPKGEANASKLGVFKKKGEKKKGKKKGGFFWRRSLF